MKKDLNGWKLGRVVTVMDAGFSSEGNRRILRGAADGYIIGEKMRQGRDGEPADAAQRAGSYKKLHCGLEAKEVIIGQGVTRRRFIIVRNPEEAERDREKRADIINEATRRLEGLKQLKGEPHTKAACVLRSHSAYGRYVKQSKTGALSLDKAKIKRDSRLDGKYLISTSEDSLPVEDVVLAYKNLWCIERLNRDLKHLVDIRPVYHRLEDRIRWHVLLCWLALLLIRVAKNETDLTWRQLTSALSKLQVGIHGTQSGEVWQATAHSRAEENLRRASSGAAAEVSLHRCLKERKRIDTTTPAQKHPKHLLHAALLPKLCRYLLFNASLKAKIPPKTLRMAIGVVLLSVIGMSDTDGGLGHRR